jgi:hypothetical protein
LEQLRCSIYLIPDSAMVEATTLVALLLTPLGAGITCCLVGVACDITQPPYFWGGYITTASSPFLNL